MAQEEAVDEDILELRKRFLNRQFDEVKFEIDGERCAEYARVCGEITPRFTDPRDPDFQAPPTFVSTLVGGRSMPPDFPNLGGMGMDAGKGVEWKAPIRAGDTLTGRSHLHDIYTKTGAFRAHGVPGHSHGTARSRRHPHRQCRHPHQ